MRFLKKISTAFAVLKTSGIKGIYQIIQAKLDWAYRPDEAHIIFQALTQDQDTGIMIDVGAHHGASLAPFAGAAWQVYAFEPDTHNRSVLGETFKGFSNVIIDPRACSDQVQPDAILYASEESTGVSGLSAFLPSHQAAEQVSVTTLAQAMADYDIHEQQVDFLKIDTEGFDLKVLEGYPWQDTNHPRVILCEFEDAKTEPLGYHFDDLAAFLSARGYQLIISEWYPVKAYGSLHRWRRFCTYPCQLEDLDGWGNILAVKDQDLFFAISRLCNL